MNGESRIGVLGWITFVGLTIFAGGLALAGGGWLHGLIHKPPPPLSDDFSAAVEHSNDVLQAAKMEHAAATSLDHDTRLALGLEGASPPEKSPDKRLVKKPKAPEGPE